MSSSPKVKENDNMRVAEGETVMSKLIEEKERLLRQSKEFYESYMQKLKTIICSGKNSFSNR